MIRISTKTDRGAIGELVDLAFKSSVYESRLIDIVVHKGQGYFEWVVERDSKIIGHILYTPATRGATILGYHLAPVSVHPDFQNEGVGSQLIRETLKLNPIGKMCVFVLGDPDFYQRFGFEKAGTVMCPYDESNDYFRALRWVDDCDPFTIGYCSAFTEAEQNVAEQDAAPDSE